MLLSNEILLIVIRSCFNQFTPSRGVILALFVIRSGSLVCLLLYSMCTHIFPRNVISFLFTSWYLSFSGWISYGLYSVGLFRMMESRCQWWTFGFFRLFLFRRRNGHYCPVLFCLFVWFGVFLRVRCLHCFLRRSYLPDNWFFLFCLVSYGIPGRSVLFSDNYCILPF